MYKCKPERSVKQVRIIVWCGFLLIAASFLAAVLLKEYNSVFNLLGFAAICAEIMLLVRFVLSEYEYSVDGESFTVTRITGKRRTDMCCVSLSTGIGVISKKEYDYLKPAEKAKIKYTMNQNIRARSSVFLFEFNGARAMIEFEPNEAFAAIMRQQIEDAKKTGESAEEEKDAV